MRGAGGEGRQGGEWNVFEKCGVQVIVGCRAAIGGVLRAGRETVMVCRTVRVSWNSKVLRFPLESQTARKDEGKAGRCPDR